MGDHEWETIEIPGTDQNGDPILRKRCRICEILQRTYPPHNPSAPRPGCTQNNLPCGCSISFLPGPDTIEGGGRKGEQLEGSGGGHG